MQEKAEGMAEEAKGEAVEEMKQQAEGMVDEAKGEAAEAAEKATE